MILDPSRIADLKELDRAISNSKSPLERSKYAKIQANIMRMAQNEKLSKLREQTTIAIQKGDTRAVEHLNKKSLEITHGQFWFTNHTLDYSGYLWYVGSSNRNNC